MEDVMFDSEFVQTAAQFVLMVFVLIGILSTMVTVEYVRYLLRRRAWMRDNAGIVGSRAVVTTNEDGASLLENGVRVPALKVGEDWRYRHQVGEEVEVVGYPSFQNILAEPPVTITATPVR